MCLMCQTTEKDPREGIPLSAWTGRAMEKNWLERPSDGQLREARKRTGRAITPAIEAVCVPAHLVPPGSPQAKQLCHLHAQLTLGQSCQRQKKKKNCLYVRRVASALSDSFRPCRLAYQASLSLRGFSRQEYWSVLANTGCHALLEHYISNYPSHQPSWVPGAAKTPAIQAAAPLPHLALTVTNPSPPGQLQELNHSGRPTCRGGNKTTVGSQGQCG